MGNPCPDCWPVLVDDLFYKVTMQAHGFAVPIQECNGPVLGYPECCHTGAQIKNWVIPQLHCSGVELCVFSGNSEQRIYNIEGPYDDYDTCFLDLYS